MIEALTVNALRRIALSTAIAVLDPFKRWSVHRTPDTVMPAWRRNGWLAEDAGLRCS